MPPVSYFDFLILRILYLPLERKASYRWNHIIVNEFHWRPLWTPHRRIVVAPGNYGTLSRLEELRQGVYLRCKGLSSLDVVLNRIYACVLYS